MPAPRRRLPLHTGLRLPIVAWVGLGAPAARTRSRSNGLGITVVCRCREGQSTSWIGRSGNGPYGRILASSFATVGLHDPFESYSNKPPIRDFLRVARAHQPEESLKAFMDPLADAVCCAAKWLKSTAC